MAKKKPRKRSEAQTKRHEIQGVLLIALGAFLAICLYFGAIGMVGEAVTDILFGLVGAFAYALPPVLIAGGVLFIAYALSAPQRGRASLIMLGVFFAVTLLHVIAQRAVTNVGFFDYVRDAYTLGVSAMRGGGAIGALLCYPALVLLGEAGAYIFLIAGVLIVILLVTRLSLRETGEKVGAHVMQSARIVRERHAERKRLYTEALANEPEAPILPKKKKQRAYGALRPQPDGPDIDFLPTEGLMRRRPKQSMRDRTDDEIAIEYCEDIPPFEPDDFVSAPIAVAPAPVVTPMPEPEFYNSPVIVRDLKKQQSVDAHVVEPEVLLDVVSEAKAERPPYVPPSFSLLNPPRAFYGRSTESPAEKGKILIETLESFHVQARVVNISVGPVITRFELAPAPGVRVNKITALSDDIALALAAPRVRIEAPIPGKAAVGIEVPNKDPATVVLRDIVESREFTSATSPITLALGKDIAGKVIVADLAKMPHLLIAGATGSGKSVCINDIIISLVYKCTPDELQLILVDPKVVELSSFSVLPHLKVPVVTDPKKAAGALAGGVREMTERYQRFAATGARDLARFNELQQDEKDRLPKLVIVIDELADLMMVAPDTVEDSICRIAQLGRAAGIHLIVATQRPSADVITGLIKANIPSRIAFSVASAIDSRIILDQGGAEKLLGRGDMLFHANGAGKPVRAQAAFVSDEEVERIVKHFQAQALTPTFDEQLIEEMDIRDQGDKMGNGKQEDELLGEAVRIVLDSGQASISMIQRRLRVGYARAARLVDIMEQHGYVSGFDGSKPRKLLITRAQYEQLFGQQAMDIGGLEDE